MSDTREPEQARSRRTPVLTTLTAGTGSALGAGAVSAWHGMAALPTVAIGLLPVLILISVVLPAIWSRKPERREAAYNVIRLLFTGAPAEPDAPANGSDSDRALPRQKETTRS